MKGDGTVSVREEEGNTKEKQKGWKRGGKEIRYCHV
jgi:hypothetical protein